jgi:chromosomal replication initiator protein
VANKAHRTTKTSPAISRLPLERPASASIRRLLPTLTDSWLLPHYLVGPENDGLRYLFDDNTLNSLGQISPILIFGEKQLGKTALAITLALRWSQLTKARPLCFTTGGSFAADLATAFEIDDITSFRRRIRDSKMLVIDDIDAIAGKPATQDELSASIDHLLAQGKPLIVTSSRLPQLLKGIRTPLASRLVPGYSIGLAKPSAATRAELVFELIEQLKSPLPADGLCQVVDKLSSTTPLTAFQIRDVLTIANQQLNFNYELDLEIVTRLAQQHVRNEGPSVALIAKAVAKRMQLKLVDIRGSARHAHLIRARGMAIYLARRLTSDSLQQIGEFFGGRDHSTILHACRKAEELLASNPEFANLARDIQADLLHGPAG